MDMGLTDKLCVVTGASSGIGLATARKLSAEGARVLLVARDAEKLEVAAARVGGEYIAADVTDAEADELIIATCAEQMGGIDVLVNNAGTSYIQPARRAHRRRMAPAVRAACDGADAADARRRAADGGPWRRSDRQRVLVVGQAPLADEPGLLRHEGCAALAVARLRRRVRARRGAHQRGHARADRQRALAGARRHGEQLGKQRGLTPEEALAQQRDKVPIGRYGSPDEVADVIVFLCSERASNVTGAAWSVDGGQVPVII
jgi:3-oxoacyl-[acyl-carrier protein] reductase